MTRILERAMHILIPLIKTNEPDNPKDEQETFLYGFKGVPVFGYSQTDGEELPRDERAEQFLDSLPFVDVARHWGLTVESYNGSNSAIQGRYRLGKGIAVGVENLSTWAHELIHSADHRAGYIKHGGQELTNEVVAELGGATILEMIGLESEADRGGCYQYVKAYADKNGKDIISVCQKLLKRTAQAIALILDTAQSLENEVETAA